MKKHNQQNNNKRNDQQIVDDAYNIDQNYRKTQNSSIIDLITPKQKQLQKKRDRLGHKHVASDGSDYDNDGQHYQFVDEEEKADYNRNRYGEKQLGKQEKQKMLQFINRMMAKNKINNKTAFDFPVLSVSDFTMHDEGACKGEIAWSKMSSILQNDYKIYGVRVDTIAEYVRRMSDSLGRKQTILNPKDQNNANKSQKQKIEKQERQAKMAQLMSTQVKNNLTLHLERNSQNLDINLRTKLMMRKDPLFQRTSRKFDHSSYSSFFLNTLSFSAGLWMQINTSENDQYQNGEQKQNNGNQMRDQKQENMENMEKQVQNHEAQGKQQTQNKNILIEQNNNILIEQNNNMAIEHNKIEIEQKARNEPSFTPNPNINRQPMHQNENNQKQYMKLIAPQLLRTVKVEIKSRKQIKKLCRSLQKLNIQVYPHQLLTSYDQQNYEKMLRMLELGQLQSCFLVGKDIRYEGSQDQNQQQEGQNNIFQDDQHKSNQKIENNDKQKDGQVINSEQGNNQNAENQGQLIQSDIKNEEEQQHQANIWNQAELGKQNEVDQNNGHINVVSSQQQRQQPQMTLIENPPPPQIIPQTTIPPQKIDKKSRKIAQVIKVHQSQPAKQKKQRTQTRNRQLNKQIQQIIKKERKTASQHKKEKAQKQLFDPQIKQKFIKVLKRQKITTTVKNNLEIDLYCDKNVIQPAICCRFQIKWLIQLRPMPTKEELRKEKMRVLEVIDLEKLDTQAKLQIIRQRQAEGLQQARQSYLSKQRQAQNSSQSQQDSEAEPILRLQLATKKATITTVKQNMYSILKQGRATSLITLHQDYKKYYGDIAASTLFIAMLHLANERYIKCSQRGNKDFDIVLAEQP